MSPLRDPDGAESGLVPLHYYVYGTRVDDLDPPLEFLAEDDWMTPLNAWIAENYPGATWYAVTAGSGPESRMKAVWIGTEPGRVDPGDAVRTLRVGGADV